ncbi:hypothetical protein HN512_03975 [Candidatus Peregrinibacteria bacterium]|jgi:hypothetical protein|nr:hypothetical protein [Candidatus Peregrinibacteria bacterium]MBT3598967.1 hypothetical protein [Candidatus Peregrinibacteria bacterium]MBT4366870.1 hypothetical protein [Candidatus Peregrinibacteria bacterium]MBT4585507.1 hypothetical protein [Candidatus Peregrinibacteria bacterium]MBT6731322.1 hypothetical protein [Candidatus Peregrinibacteria bacterium]
MNIKTRNWREDDEGGEDEEEKIQLTEEDAIPLTELDEVPNINPYKGLALSAYEIIFNEANSRLTYIFSSLNRRDGNDTKPPSTISTDPYEYRSFDLRIFSLQKHEPTKQREPESEEFIDPYDCEEFQAAEVLDLPIDEISDEAFCAIFEELDFPIERLSKERAKELTDQVRSGQRRLLADLKYDEQGEQNVPNRSEIKEFRRMLDTDGEGETELY